MRVASQILHDDVGTGEGSFGIDDPVRGTRLRQQPLKGITVGNVVGELERIPSIEAFQALDELPAEDCAQHPIGEKIVFLENLDLSRCRNATCRNHTVDVRMKLQKLPPRMEDGKESKRHPEVLFPKLEERRPDRLKEKLVHGSFVKEHHAVQRIGEREYRMEVRHRKQFLGPGIDPSRRFTSLTLGTVPVSARVVRLLDVRAVGTPVDVAAELGSPAPHNVASHLSMRRSNGVFQSVPLPVRPEHVSYLNYRAAHWFNVSSVPVTERNTFVDT